MKTQTIVKYVSDSGKAFDTPEEAAREDARNQMKQLSLKLTNQVYPGCSEDWERVKTLTDGLFMISMFGVWKVAREIFRISKQLDADFCATNTRRKPCNGTR